MSWAAALGWPLVWDQDGETAIRQHETSGVYITWGPSDTPKPGKNRLHLRRSDRHQGVLAIEVDRSCAHIVERSFLRVIAQADPRRDMTPDRHDVPGTNGGRSDDLDPRTVREGRSEKRVLAADRLVAGRQHLRQRHPMPADDAQRLGRGTIFAVEKPLIERDQQAQQRQRHGRAREREQRSPPVAEDVSNYQRHQSKHAPIPTRRVPRSRQRTTAVRSLPESVIQLAGILAPERLIGRRLIRGTERCVDQPAVTSLP